MDSDRGVWFPPRPLEGGTPTSRVGGVLTLANDVASSVDMIDSTSSMHISTFSGFRSDEMVSTKIRKEQRLTCMDDATTSMHVI